MSLYMLFTGSNYYPSGGLNDLHEAFTATDDEAAKDHALNAVADAARAFNDWWTLSRIDVAEDGTVTHEEVWSKW